MIPNIQKINSEKEKRKKKEEYYDNTTEYEDIIYNKTWSVLEIHDYIKERLDNISAEIENLELKINKKKHISFDQVISLKIYSLQKRLDYLYKYPTPYDYTIKSLPFISKLIDK